MSQFAHSDEEVIVSCTKRQCIVHGALQIPIWHKGCVTQKKKNCTSSHIIKHEVLWYIHQLELNVPTYSDVTFKGDDDMLSHENGYLF